MGPARGFPLIAHHGTPSCRLDRPARALDGRLADVRLISFDRPGYGGSPARPGRDVAAAAGDVTAIADALGLDAFAVYGVSGGGPHALACAALLGERVTRVAVSGCIGPADDPGLDWFAGMHPLSVPEFRAAMEGRAALEPLVRPYVEARAERSPRGLGRAGSTACRSRTGAYSSIRRDASPTPSAELEANRQAGEGWIDDDLALLRPWGFELEAIAVPVRLWQGDVDVIVPPAHSRRLAARIPTAELVTVPGAGHWLDAQHPDMLAWLAAPLRRSRRSRSRRLGAEHAADVRRGIDRRQRGRLHRDELARPSRRRGRSGRRCRDRAPPAPASAPVRRTARRAPSTLTHRLGDVAAHLGVDEVEVGEEGVADARPRARRAARARGAAAVDHDHAALLRPRAVHEVGVVEEHVEAQIRREDRVQVVPRHRRRLVGAGC